MKIMEMASFWLPLNETNEEPGFKVRCISASAFEGFLTEHNVKVQIT